MSPPLAIEDDLILACARTAPDRRRIEALIERGLDWEVVLRRVGRWSVGPLVYAGLRQAAETGRVPEAITQRLKHLCRREAIYDVVQRQALRGALLRLSEANVPVVVLKGAALAALVYPSPTLRPMGDVDLLVHTRDRERAEALARGTEGTPRSLPHRVQIHEHILPAAMRIPIEDIWERTRPAGIESVATLVLSHEDLLLQLAVDLTMRLSEPRRVVGCVRTLCDIAETCRRYGDAIDWGRLVVQAEAYDMAEQLCASLRLARDAMGAHVPSADLNARSDRSTLEDEFTAVLARDASISENRATDSRNAGPGSGASRTSEATRGGSPGGSGEVAVTYDPIPTDGVGSQLHRIYGLYALSRALGVKYIHTPLARVGYQGFLPLLAGRTDPDFAARYNAFFSLPSDDFDLESCERIHVHILRGETVEHYREHAAGTGRPVLLQAIHHYGYTDGHPEALQVLRAVSPYRAYRAAGPVRVCIHLRRGDNSVPGRSDVQQRLLPNEYYLRACNVVLEALRRHGVPFVVRLHSEVPPRRFTLYPDTPGLYFWLDEPATVDPSAYGLDEFESLPNLETVLNVDAREAIDDFATADVLILSRSSLGYLGGLLNPHGLVVYAPWWHPALPDWLVADERGHLDAALVANRIGDHVRRRS